MCFEFYNMTSYPGNRSLQHYTNVFMTQEILYYPCKRFTTGCMCSNSLKCNYHEKADHKKRPFRENGVKKS